MRYLSQSKSAKIIYKLFNITISFLFWLFILICIINYLFSDFEYSLPDFDFAKDFIKLETKINLIIAFTAIICLTKNALIIKTIFVVSLFFINLNFNSFPQKQLIINMQSCYEDGICHEGINNTTKTSCLTDNAFWNNDNKTCYKLTYSKKDCHKLKGDWEYPDICK